MLLTSWDERAVGRLSRGMGRGGEQVKLINKKMPHAYTVRHP